MSGEETWIRSSIKLDQDADYSWTNERMREPMCSDTKTTQGNDVLLCNFANILIRMLPSGK